MQFLKNISLTYKIFLSSVILCFIALVIMGNINYYQTSKRIKKFHESNFNKKELIVLKSFEYFANDSTNLTPEKIELKLRELAKINSLVIEFYDLEYHLIASNLGKFDAKKLNQDVINQLEKKDFDSKNFNNEKRNFAVNKININQKDFGYLYIVYFKNNHYLNAEINQLIKQYVFLMLFLVFLSAVLAWIISNNITKKIKEISEKLMNTDILSTNNFLNYPNNDEITPLVSSYNIMLEKIEN
jgi:methyl-accepting chemotaxis protein